MKEADALVEAGHEVNVVGAYWADWATEMDRSLLGSRAWRFAFIDWRRRRDPVLFYWSRVRHLAARRISTVAPITAELAAAALCRVGPELRTAAAAVRANLYIAHNLGALPAALFAASVWSAGVGFDAEDFHSGQFPETRQSRFAGFVRRVERHFISRCAYVTAAAPGIAEAYRDLCRVPLPTVVLNVFPLADRPIQFRPDVSGAPLRLYWFSQTVGPDRGIEDVVRAMGLLQPCHIELHLRGAWQAGYEGNLRKLAREAGVSEGCILGHEPAAPDEMVRMASAYDVGLAVEPLSSMNNDVALSNKIFTYLLAGVAVLATETKGQARLRPDLGGAATYCRPGNPESMAAALAIWVRSRAALMDARQAAWRLGEARFNWDREKAMFLGSVERVFSGNG